MIYKVLLVEDERTLSGIVRDALETMDFSVEQAYDGSEGLRRYFMTARKASAGILKSVPTSLWWT